MIPFEELCEALDRWNARRGSGEAPPPKARAAEPAPARDPYRAAAGGTPNPAPAPITIAPSLEQPSEDATGEIDLDEDLVDL